ncbi:MAG: hypothetical protein IMY82_03440, partial [Chloroflexi bacterium]|nr:hypothetical protein [Chloroflexota bacterium]
MSHKFVAYGQILDEFVIGNLWRMTANQFPADFKIRNISVFLQSSLAGMRRGGRSRLSFHIDSGQISDVSPWIQSTLKYFDRSPHADVAYCHPESQLVSYSYRLAGDFIEEKLMDKLADNLE